MFTVAKIDGWYMLDGVKVGMRVGALRFAVREKYGEVTDTILTNAIDRTRHLGQVVTVYCAHDGWTHDKMMRRR